MAWNVNGIRARWHENHTVFSDSDIVVLTETKLDATATSASFSLPGFQLYRRDRSRHGGGVLMYVKNSLRPAPLTQLQQKSADDGLEVIIFLVHLKNKADKIVIVGVYRPPSSKISWFDAFIDLILKLKSIGPLIILGDLNFDLMKPEA